MSNPVELLLAFFKSEDPVEMVGLHEELLAACEVASTATPRERMARMQARTGHHFRCAQLWKVLGEKLASSVHYVPGENPELERARVLVVGAGPAGLRTGIELLLLGAKSITVVERRPYFSRNNVLKVWKSTVQDYNELGMKFFFPRFCLAGNDHVSIRRVQIVLAKVFLLLGGELWLGASFDNLQPPGAHSRAWRATVTIAAGHKPQEPVQRLVECDVCVGADGERSGVATVGGFEFGVMGGTRALGVTFNFKNSNSVEEICLRQFGYVRYLVPKFFGSLKADHGIDLESIAYFRDETHYFVMSVTTESLVACGVLRQSFDSVRDLLRPSNVDREALERFARTIATHCELPEHLPFATNHHGEADIGVFDFTTKRVARHATRVLAHPQAPLLVGLVGDALIAPFWPQATGANRCGLGALDLAWTILQYTRALRKPQQDSAEPGTGGGGGGGGRGGDLAKEGVLTVLREHEMLFRLLQLTPNTLQSLPDPSSGDVGGCGGAASGSMSARRSSLRAAPSPNPRGRYSMHDGDVDDRNSHLLWLPVSDQWDARKAWQQQQQQQEQPQQVAVPLVASSMPLEAAAWGMPNSQLD